MDEKLKEYRTKVRRKEFFDKIKQRLINMVTFAPETNHKKDETIEIPDVSQIAKHKLKIIAKKLNVNVYFSQKKRRNWKNKRR